MKPCYAIAIFQQEVEEEETLFMRQQKRIENDIDSYLGTINYAILTLLIFQEKEDRERAMMYLHGFPSATMTKPMIYLVEEAST